MSIEKAWKPPIARQKTGGFSVKNSALLLCRLPNKPPLYRRFLSGLCVSFCEVFVRPTTRYCVRRGGARVDIVVATHVLPRHSRHRHAATETPSRPRRVPCRPPLPFAAHGYTLLPPPKKQKDDAKHRRAPSFAPPDAPTSLPLSFLPLTASLAATATLRCRPRRAPAPLSAASSSPAPFPVGHFPCRHPSLPHPSWPALFFVNTVLCRRARTTSHAQCDYKMRTPLPPTPKV